MPTQAFTWGWQNVCNCLNQYKSIAKLTREQTAVIFEIKCTHFLSRKCICNLHNGGRIVQALAYKFILNFAVFHPSLYNPYAWLNPDNNAVYTQNGSQMDPNLIATEKCYCKSTLTVMQKKWIIQDILRGVLKFTYFPPRRCAQISVINSPSRTLWVRIQIKLITSFTLPWRHNELDDISNHRCLDCLLNRLFRRRSKKTSKFRATGLCEGNAPVTGGLPSQRASDAEKFPSDDAIMLRKGAGTCLKRHSVTVVTSLWITSGWHRCLIFRQCVRLPKLNISCERIPE